MYKLGKSITSLFVDEGILGVDKSAAEGRVVELKGDTFELLKSAKQKRTREKAFGVYTAGSWRRVVLMSGERVEVTIPESIIVKGSALVRVATSERSNL